MKVKTYPDASLPAKTLASTATCPIFLRPQSRFNLRQVGTTKVIKIIHGLSALVCDYILRYERRRDDVRLSRAFKVFAGFLCLAIVLFLAGCCYRIDELSHGYSGETVK
jgi:hypothetical protein